MAGTWRRWATRSVVLLTATTGAALGLIVAFALGSDVAAVILLAAIVALSVAGGASAVRRTDADVRLDLISRFSRTVARARNVDEVLTSLLVQAQEACAAGHVELALAPSVRESARESAREEGEGHGVRVTVGARGELVRKPAAIALLPDPHRRDVVPLLLPRRARGARGALLTALGLQEAVAVPLPGESSLVGALIVGDRESGRGFDGEDVRLLETLVNFAAVALENERLLVRLREDAEHDALTGLPDRALLEQRIGEALGNGGSCAVLLLDLDDFKALNETFGRPGGDRVLVEIAARLRDAAGPEALVVRLGGDEFAVLLPGATDPTPALLAARALGHALESPLTVAGSPVEVSASIGVALAPEHGADAATLLQRADHAMGAAKRSASGAELYDARYEPREPARLALVGELRRALAHDEFEVHVQPKALMATGVVHAVEALVRWRHPDQGIIGPDHFVPLAERSGLIRPLTTVVLNGALAACASWRQAGVEVGVAVNLSARSLTDLDLVDEVDQALATYRLPPQLLTLEITESTVMADPTRAVEVLRRLHARGLRLSLDDFGTGYSSLSYLRSLPVHEVKIDRSFVAGMLTLEDDLLIVRSIIDLAGNLALDVVAEGVEDAATWQRLAEMGCDFVQGYYLARPLPTEEFLSWYRAYERRRIPVVSVPRLA